MPNKPSHTYNVGIIILTLQVRETFPISMHRYSAITPFTQYYGQGNLCSDEYSFGQPQLNED